MRNLGFFLFAFIIFVSAIGADYFGYGFETIKGLIITKESRTTVVDNVIARENEIIKRVPFAYKKEKMVNEHYRKVKVETRGQFTCKEHEKEKISVFSDKKYYHLLSKTSSKKVKFLLVNNFTHEKDVVWMSGENIYQKILRKYKDKEMSLQVAKKKFAFYMKQFYKKIGINLYEYQKNTKVDLLDFSSFKRFDTLKSAFRYYGRKYE